MTLHLLHLPVSPRELIRCGRASGLVDDRQAADLGYLMHGLFKRLAETPPAPFDIQPHVSGNAPPEALSVLAYSGRDIAAFRAEARTRDDTVGLAAIDWRHADSKPMPCLAAGHTVGFRVRVCPTVRVGRQHPRLRSGAEVDPYVALLQRHFAEHLVGTPDTDLSPALRRALMDELPAREAVYRDWLAARIGDAASLTVARLVSQCDAALWRKGEPKAGPAALMYGSLRRRHGRRSVIGRREAVFEGTLQVTDATGFAMLLARGVGRHRAFGFGMLLLRSVTNVEG